MSQQSSAALLTLDAWQQWEGRVVGGRFALGPYLGGSDHSAVYFTDLAGSRAVVKMVAANTADAQLQLPRWEAARQLAHPNLLRVFETGLWHADEEQDMSFAVMEYAEENLGEVLAQRALAPTETRDMLIPTLLALEYLHRQNLVHGDLKPSNVMAVGQELKLAVDGVRRTGSHVAGCEHDDWRASPEVFNSNVSARSDIWALGLLLLESLTKQQLVWDNSKDDEPRLPGSLPEPFGTIIRECLQRDPAKRCTIADIRAVLGRPLEARKLDIQVVPITERARESCSKSADEVDEPEMPTDDRKAAPGSTPASKIETKAASLAAITAGGRLPDLAPAESPSASHDTHSPYALASPRRSFLRFSMVLFVAMLALVGVVWVFGHRPQTTEPDQVASQSGVLSTTASKPTPQQAPAANPTRIRSAGAVAHQVMPEVSRTAQNTLHGAVKVRVQVNVNEAGTVTLAGLTAHGPSRYFARQALEAARTWTFTPPVVDGRPVASRWALEFDFRRSGVKSESKVISPRV